MRVLVIGSGGREHALVWKLRQSPRVSQVYCAPGNAGAAADAEYLPADVKNIESLLALAARVRPALTVVGPELPLQLGVVDEFTRHGYRIFGHTQAAAQLESSKSFAKEFMQRHHIPTANYAICDTLEDVSDALPHFHMPVVVKADGLAQGKGVVVAMTREEATQAIRDSMEHAVFGQAGQRVLIEQFLDGEELTIMAFTDGRTVVPMLPAQDHKRVRDGDTGPNTGGMGAYCPAPLGTMARREQVTRQVLYPAVEALSRMGCPFQGVLYTGLMIVKGTPYVLEFNARMGDPETRVVLPLLKTDLLEVMEAVVEHRLDQLTVN